MTFELWPALLAGVIGGAAMVVARMLLRAVGMPLRMDVLRIWGTLLGAHGPPGRMVGAVIHLVVSAVVGLVYGWGFDLFEANTNLWVWGVLGGSTHWVIAGIMMSVLPVAHPEIPDQREAPGPFVTNFGSQDVVGFLIGHVAYGVTVAIAYGWIAEGAEAPF